MVHCVEGTSLYTMYTGWGARGRGMGCCNRLTCGTTEPHLENSLCSATLATVQCDVRAAVACIENEDTTEPRLAQPKPGLRGWDDEIVRRVDDGSNLAA